MPVTALPIDPLLPEIVASLRKNPSLVLEAPPGAGKTTRVPPALLDVVDGQILVLEPRRLAARLAGISLLAIRKPVHALTAPNAQRSMQGTCT